MKTRTKLLALLLSLIMLLSLAACGQASADVPAENVAAEAPAETVKADPVVSRLLGRDAQPIVRMDLPSARDYFLAVEQRHDEEMLSVLRSGTNLDPLTSFRESELSLTLDQSVLEQDLLDLLTEALGMDLSWLEKLSLNIVGGSDGELTQANYALRLNDKDIVHLNMLMDLPNLTWYLTVPELSETYCSVNIKEQLGEQVGAGMDPTEYAELLQELNSNSDAYLGLLLRYFQLAVEKIDDIQVGEDSITAGGITCPCTAAELHVDGEDLLEIAKACLDTAAEDKDLEKLVYMLMRMNGSFTGSAEEFSESYQEGVQELQDELKDTTPEDVDVNLTLRAFIDEKGELLGTHLELLSEGEKKLDLSLLTARDGDKLGLDGRFGFFDKGGSSDGSYSWETQTVVSLSGDGTYTPEGELSGEFALSLYRLNDSNGNKEETDLPLGSVKIDGQIGENGFLGEILYTPSTELLDLCMEELGEVPEPVEKLIRSLSLALVNSSKDETTDFAAILRSNGKDLLTLRITQQPTEPFAISLPADAVDMETWQNNLNYAGVNEIYNRLREAGVPTALLNSVMG